MTPFIIPFFIAHQGCPHHCVFCNQRAISGTNGQRLQPEDMGARIRHYLAGAAPGRPVEVAFYGGSFTCLPPDVQAGYLAAVAPFLAAGRVGMVRVSTRPDCLDREQIRWLRQQGVGLVEVGVQSMHDDVLRRAGRGHDVAQVVTAFQLLRQEGMAAGGQLMVGLPGDTPGRAVTSSRRLAALGPRLVRIYATVVVAGSELASHYARGDYQPWSLARSVTVAAAMKDVFDAQGIPVIRLGLQVSASLRENMVAGPFHPAFGEMVLSRQFFRKVRALLRRDTMARPHLLLASRDRSLFSGVARENFHRLHGLGLLAGRKIHFCHDRPRFFMKLQHESPDDNTLAKE